METLNSSADKPNSGGAGGKETAKQKVEEEARKAKQDASAEAHEQAEAGQHHVADEAGALSDAIDSAASKLDEQDREGLARYAHEMSRNLASAARHIEDRSVDDLANDAKRLAQKNPALFMAGSIAIGFGLSRFFKASTEHGNDERLNTSPRTGTQDREPGLTAADPLSTDPQMSPNPQTQDGRQAP